MSIPRVKQLEIHSLLTKIPRQESRAIRGGGWTLHRPHISCSQSQETSLTTHTWKRPLGGQRRVMSRDVLLRQLFGRIHLGYEMCAHTGKDPDIYQIQTVNQPNQNDCTKETQKKYPIKVIQTTMRV